MLWFGLANAATWTVSEGESIQTAIESATDGDLIEVGPGTYPERLDFLGKDLVVRSTDGPESTVLDGEDVWDTSVVSFTSGEPITATLSGFTVTNGHGQPFVWEVGRGWVGAGVLIKDSAATVTDCLFLENHSRHSGQSLGAGVAVVKSEALLRDNTFRDNLGFWGGGGVGLVQSTAHLEGNTFEGNLGTRGAGLIVLENSTAELTGNTFSDNHAGHGGHVYVKDSVLSSAGDTFQGGRAWRNGGAVVVVDGHATFAEAHFEDNHADHDGGHVWVAWSGGVTVMSSWMGSSSAQAGAVAFARGAALTLEGVWVESPAADAIWAWEAAVQLFNLTVSQPASPLVNAQNSGGSALNVLVTGGEGPVVQGLDWSYGLAWNITDAPADSLQADPLLEGGVPSPESPAIDAGTPLWTDLDGSPSDIGATGGRTPWSP